MVNLFTEGRKKKEEKGKNKRKGGNLSDEEEQAPKTGRKKQKKKLETDSAIASVLPGLSIAHPSDVLDMPVDPNEPTYCLCHQVSYGEMIACDKMDVSILSVIFIMYNQPFILLVISYELMDDFCGICLIYKC